MANSLFKNSTLFDTHIELRDGQEEILYSYEEFLTHFFPDFCVREGMVWATSLDTWVPCKELVTELRSDALWIYGQKQQSKMDALEMGIFNWYDKC